MAEVPTHDEAEHPASPDPEKEAIYAEAKRVGEEAARRVRDTLAGLEFRTGNMTWWPHDASRKAEAEVLYKHGLIDDAELERRSTPPERKGVGRGTTITM